MIPVIGKERGIRKILTGSAVAGLVVFLSACDQQSATPPVWQEAETVQPEHQEQAPFDLAPQQQEPAIPQE